jgi:amino acid transporter
MAVGTRGRPGRVGSTLLAADRLGIADVIYFVATAAAPLTVVAGVISTAWLVTGIAGLPLAFLAVGGVLAVFCAGYVAMSRRVRNAGAFYTYIARGLGKPLGVAGAFIAVPAYSMMQVASYGGIGAATHAILADKAGVSVPWWLPAAAGWALVAVLGVRRVEVNGRVLAVALLAEIAIILVADTVDVVHPAGGHLSMATLQPHALAGAGLGVAAAIAVTAFIGFETPAVFSEESRRADRTIPRATYLSLALITALFAGSSWAMAAAIGPGLQGAAQRYGTDLPFAVAATHLGTTTVIDVGRVLFVTSLLAAAISYHNTVARYTFALGREQVLPALFGRTSRRSFAPKYASLAQSAVGFTVIAVYAVLGLDPLVHLFYWLATAGAFGILLLICGTSAAVVGFFAHDPDGENLWRRLIAPALAFVGLAGVIYLIHHNFAALLGVDPASPLAWAFPALYLLLAAAGIGWGLILRATRPDTYAAIGLGAAPAPPPTRAAR